MKRLRWTSVGRWWLAWVSGAATARYHTLCVYGRRLGQVHGTMDRPSLVAEEPNPMHVAGGPTPALEPSGGLATVASS